MNIPVSFSLITNPVRRMRARTMDIVLWTLAIAGLLPVVFGFSVWIPPFDQSPAVAASLAGYFLIVAAALLRSLPALPGALARIAGGADGLLFASVSATAFAILAGVVAGRVMDAWMAFEKTALALPDWIIPLATNAILFAVAGILLISCDRFLRGLRRSSRRNPREVEFFD